MKHKSQGENCNPHQEEAPQKNNWTDMYPAGLLAEWVTFSMFFLGHNSTPWSKQEVALGHSGLFLFFSLFSHVFTKYGPTHIATRKGIHATSRKGLKWLIVVRAHKDINNQFYTLVKAYTFYL